MKIRSLTLFILFLIFLNVSFINSLLSQQETKAQRDERMKWWRDSRFGMFIHWGLYSIPAGEWKGKTDHGEWIRTTGQIPLEEYDKYIDQFNPTKFNAIEWVQMAKNAGMKYIVITSKHHDGFCLFDSKYTDFDVMSTPFKRDIMKELAEACRKEGMKMCWYHSIMDWHHPDYLPRREWEKERSTEGAVFDKYIQHLKNQLKELIKNYGDIGVLWFDGEWESTWNSKYGKDLYDYVRSLQPNIIINNRVGAGRSGMEGFTKEGEFSGDFGTPEQEIPATGLPGVDWETCMTMNDHWGYNKNDMNFKTTEDLIQKIADIASKGGNFLLNIGPTAEGLFPQTSIDRLKEIGEWMKVNGESIYESKSSPFKKIDWGRCTQKSIGKNTKLYLHVFDWPKDGRLIIPGIFNEPLKAYLLSDSKKSPLKTSRYEDAIVINVVNQAPNQFNSVVALEIKDKPDISEPPKIESECDIFINSIKVLIKSDRDKIEVRYTLDGSTPTVNSSLAKDFITLNDNTIVSARCFRNGKPVSGTIQKNFTKVKPRSSQNADNLITGIKYSYFEGEWDSLPDFKALKPTNEGIINNFILSPKKQNEYYAFDYSGFVNLSEDGVYSFYTDSDDGSCLYIDDELVVNNDKLHGMIEKEGIVALSAGYHSIRVSFFQKSGGVDLKVSYKGPGIKKQLIPDNILYYRK